MLFCSSSADCLAFYSGLLSQYRAYNQEVAGGARAGGGGRGGDSTQLSSAPGVSTPQVPAVVAKGFKSFAPPPVDLQFLIGSFFGISSFTCRMSMCMLRLVRHARVRSVSMLLCTYVYKDTSVGVCTMSEGGYMYAYTQGYLPCTSVWIQLYLCCTCVH